MGIAVGAFYIKDTGFNTGNKFGNASILPWIYPDIFVAWMVIGLIGGFLFILIQLVLIVDFAHGWAENWIGKYEESNSKGWYAGNKNRFKSAG